MRFDDEKDFFFYRKKLITLKIKSEKFSIFFKIFQANFNLEQQQQQQQQQQQKRRHDEFNYFQKSFNLI